MKKAFCFMLVLVMMVTFAACKNHQPSVSFEEVQKMAEKEIPVIRMMLGCEWDAQNLPEQDFLMIATAQSLYERDHGEAMPIVGVAENDYQVNEGIKMDVLIPTITKYFSFSEQLLRDGLENSLIYDAQNDAVILSDGWGWSLDAVMHDVTDNQDGTYDIAYGLYTNDDLEYEGVVKAKVHPDGYMQFISNVYYSVI